MPGFTTFDSTAESLADLLDSIDKSRTQLPDFQRGWIWDDERIKNLLVSISLSHPVGAIMMLQTGNPEVKFKPRPIEGVESDSSVEPQRLILDGQQRLTSLFQSLKMRKPVKTKDHRGNEVERHYYIDVDVITDPNADKDEAIVGVPGDRIVRGRGRTILADYSDVKKECDAGMLPVSLLFWPEGLFKWQTEYFSDPSKVPERSEKWTALLGHVFPQFQNYQVPIIMLRQNIRKEAVCQVFEHVNTGGVALTVFELLTAAFAADDFELRKDWDKKLHRMTGTSDMHTKVLADVTSTDLLQAVCLLTSYNRKRRATFGAVTCKRKDILRLGLDDYLDWGEKAVDGFIEAAKLLQEQHIFSARDLPYGSQLIPLATILVELGSKAQNLAARKKIARWYWCGVLGELYGGGTETRFARDLPEVVDWLDNGHEPTTVIDASFSADRLYSLRTRNSAAYKGIHALLMKSGCRDFISGVSIDLQTYGGEQIDIHHIFPRAYCLEQGIESKYFDSIVNKTPLSYRTNRIVGGDGPSVYLGRIEKERGLSPVDVDTLLETHLINPEPVRSDCFDEFFAERKNCLIGLIESAMGKRVVVSEESLPG